MHESNNNNRKAGLITQLMFELQTVQEYDYPKGKCKQNRRKDTLLDS